MSVDIRNEQSIIKIDFLKDVVLKIIDILHLDGYQLSILIVNNGYIKKINKKYLNKNEPTDVLTFNMKDEDNKYSGLNQILGDIVISAEMAKIRADELKISENKELVFYLIHGILHLLGDNDDTLLSREKMHKKQNEILNQLKF